MKDENRTMIGGGRKKVRAHRPWTERGVLFVFVASPL